MEILFDLYQYNDFGLLGLRIALGAIFIVHGLKKRAMWKMQPSEQLSFRMLWILRMLSFAEPIGGIAVIAGFLTSFAVIGLSLVMVSAIFSKIMIWNTPFMAENTTGWEFDLLILAACIALLMVGAGMWSIDFFYFWAFFPIQI